jgi:enamine deaminase RidA (YjgF/YER057c/UK114 family)
MSGHVVGERLAALGLSLPPVAAPVAAYVPAARHNDLVFTSGQLPMVQGSLPATGKVGADIGVDQAKELAQICALNAIAAAGTVCDIDDIEKVVKVVVFVASATDFTSQPAIANGASELLGSVFGESGHARSAVGVAELPLDAPVEVEVIFALRG